MKKDNLPPHSVEAEQAALGGVLYDPESIVKIKGLLDIGDFYSQAHQRIYAAMLDVYEDGIDAGLVSVSVCLKDKGELEKIGGPVYLSTLCDTVPSSANIESHARIIKEKATLRRIIEQAQNIINKTNERGIKPEEIPTRLLIETSKPIEINHVSSVSKQLTKNIEAGYPGLFPCYNLLSKTIRKASPGHLWVVGAWTSVGKSAWLVDYICRTYRHSTINPGIAIFSTEMSSEQYLVRCLANETMLPGWKITDKFMTPEQQNQVEKARRDFNTKNLYIYDKLYRIEEIEHAARMIKEEKGLDIMAVDYLQNIWGEGSIYERMSRLSPILQYLSKELQVTVIALSQVSNQHARGESGGLINYKGAGEIAASADLGIELEREKDNKTRMRFIVKKNRHGMIGESVLEFTNEYTRLTEIIPETDNG
jgi:replicative DNA helicase